MDDFWVPELTTLGYKHAHSKQPDPAKDCAALFWHTQSATLLEQSAVAMPAEGANGAAVIAKLQLKDTQEVTVACLHLSSVSALPHFVRT